MARGRTGTRAPAPRPGRWRLPMTLLAVASPGLAAPEHFTIDPSHTFPQFEVSHLGFSLQRGRFNHTQGTLVLDRKARRGEVDVTIDASSVDTGLEALEKVLRGNELLHVERYPTLVFRSRQMYFRDNLPVGLEGDLTLHGVTRPVSLVITHFRCGTQPLTRQTVCGANARGSLRRSEFGMSAFLPFVGDEVAVDIQIEATRDPAL